MLVLDASAAVMTIVEEPGSDAVDRLMSQQAAIAPDLVMAEVANALWRKVRVGALGPSDVAGVLDQAGKAFTRLLPLAPLRARALDLALRRDHPVYGCLYVALAMREALPAVTADRRLAARFAGDVELRLVG